jgi:RimJ/RimL family protein N-acetyltransferase
MHERHLEQVRQWRNDPENRQYFLRETDITKEEQEEWFRKAFEDDTREDFSIFENNSDPPWSIGTCSLSNIDKELGQCEFGILLGKRKGRGLGKETMNGLLDYAFDELNMKRVYGRVFEGNPAMHLYKSLGFTIDGNEAVVKSGQDTNINIISILREGWNETK